MKKIALIPAYCPNEGLISLVQHLKKENMEPVIVNDGSDISCDWIFDACAQEASVLKQMPNGGKGAALKKGMRWIMDNEPKDSVITTVDADGQHDPHDCLRCAEMAEQHPDALILGTRNFDGPDVPFKSHWGNKITASLFHIFTGVRVSDTQTGLRSFHASLLAKMAEVPGERYEYEMNQLLACIQQHIPFEEVEIATIYEDGNSSSHFHVIRDSFLIYKQLLHFAASSLSSFAVDYLLFCLFSLLFNGLYGTVIANITARVFSACFNYEVNRRVVFKDAQSRRSSFWRYALLAIMILICNTLILSFFVYILHWHALLAKILTEIILFFFSWTIQKTYIFTSHIKGAANL